MTAGASAGSTGTTLLVAAGGARSCCCSSSTRSSTASCLSFEPKEGGGLANYLRFFSEPFLYNTIATTLWLAVPDDADQCRRWRCRSPSGCGAMRVPARCLTTILVLPITLGTVLVAEGLLNYLGPQGWVNRAADRDRPGRRRRSGSPTTTGASSSSLVITGFPFTFLLTLSYITGHRPGAGAGGGDAGRRARRGSSCTSTCRCSRPGSRSPSACPSCRPSRCSRRRCCSARRRARRASSRSPPIRPPSRSTTTRWPRRSR